MRILHTLAQFPDRTGSGIACRNIIKCLNNCTGLKDQAVIYGINPEQEVPELAAQAYPILFDTEELPFPVVGMSDVMPYRSTAHKELTETQYIQLKAAFRKTLDKAISDFKPDILFCHHLWLLSSMCLDYDLPIIGIAHGTDIRQAKQNPDLFNNYVGDLSELDLVSALSYDQIPDLEQVYGLKSGQIFVGGSGFDHELFRRDPNRKPGDEVRLLYAGRFSETKGSYELLEAFERIPQEENVSLMLLSHIEEFDQGRLESALQRDARISQHGPLSQAELANLMRDYDIFIFPSYYEGLGLMALEGMASGMDLVVTELPALKSFLGEEVWNHEYITVVDMPELVDLDRVAEKAKEGHIENLKQAIIDAAHKFRERGMTVADFTDDLASFTWQGHTQKLMNRAQDLVVKR